MSFFSCIICCVLFGWNMFCKSNHNINNHDQLAWLPKQGELLFLNNYNHQLFGKIYEQHSMVWRLHTKCKLNLFISSKWRKVFWDVRGGVQDWIRHWLLGDVWAEVRECGGGAVLPDGEGGAVRDRHRGEMRHRHRAAVRHHHRGGVRYRDCAKMTQWMILCNLTHLPYNST